MKANEAPEKIFVNPNSSAITDCTERFMFIHDNIFDESKCTIEYIRTDAFIEKACEWLRKELCDYFDAPRDNYDMFVEDFRKYMKGE